MTTNMNAINWFEIPATDLDRAAKFYEAVLATTLKREDFGGDKLAILSRGQEGGVAGALKLETHRKPSADGVCVYLDARGDIDGCIARTERAGGRVILPKTDIGPMGWIAMISDSEGNAVGLHAEKA